MAKLIYLSPSNHGVGANKCLRSGCYEDKHTRPIAEAAAKYLKASGFNVIVASADKNMSARCKEANSNGAALYVPIHTNASSAPEARYLLFMCYNTTGEYKKIFDAVKPFMAQIYNGEIKLSKRRDLYEINVPNAKTFYCEMGFHTNSYDCNNFIHNPDAIGKAIAKGICQYYGVVFKDGTEKKTIAEDGLWGVTTTKYTQKVLGTPQDGIVSGQLMSCKKYLPGVLTSSWEFKYWGSGSVMVKAIQNLVGAKADGKAGYNTVVAMQKFLKEKGLYTGAIDGVMGKLTVIAWQKYVNSRL